MVIKRKQHRGFTVIELIVSASIIAVISVLVITNYRGSTQKAALDSEAERLSSVIRQAHINSLIGLTVSGARPDGGFGIHLEECSVDCNYIIFADLNADAIFDAADIIVQTVGMLDDNVYVATLTPAGALDIVFVPPKGEIEITNYSIGGTDYIDVNTNISVILGFENTGYTKQISFDYLSGQINID